MTHPSITLLLLGAIALHGSTPAAARSCTRGTFLRDGACIPCPPGTTRTEWFTQPKHHCVPCPRGTYSPYRGVGTPDQCRPCPADTYAPDRGATECLPCPAGKTAGLGAAVCLVCGPGQHPQGFDYISLRAQRTCVACPRNTYSTGGARDCTPCPYGLGAPRGSSALSDCKLCPAGMEATTYSSTGCDKCSEGYFKAEGDTGFCTPCPLGFIQPATGGIECIPCPINTHSHPWDDKCINCSTGTITYSEGNTFCRKREEPCPPWYFESADGDCKECPSNNVPNSARTACVPCPNGTRSPGKGALECIACPAGKLAVYDGDKCKCPQGNFVAADGSCEKCPAGSFRNDHSIGSAVSYCTPCSDGVAIGRGNTECTLCPGLTVPSEDRTKCVECGPGLTGNVPSDEDEDLHCVNITTGCPPGFIRNDAGTPCEEVICQPGSDESLVGVTCLGCDKGYALSPADKSGKWWCLECPEDSVSDGGVITECKKCEKGKIRDDYDFSRCSCRRIGYGIGSDGVCRKCARGSFGMWKKEVCEICPRGTAAVKNGQRSCTKCEHGTYKAVEGPGICKKCPIGQVPNKYVGSTLCVAE